MLSASIAFNDGAMDVKERLPILNPAILLDGQFIYPCEGISLAGDATELALYFVVYVFRFGLLFYVFCFFGLAHRLILKMIYLLFDAFCFVQLADYGR